MKLGPGRPKSETKTDTENSDRVLKIQRGPHPSSGLGEAENLGVWECGAEVESSVILCIGGGEA